MSKPNILHFYLDDSGTRKMDRNPERMANPGWFAIGGVLVWDEDKDDLKQKQQVFCEKWGVNKPLHSVDIRHKKGQFYWLAKAPGTKIQRFFRDLEDLMTGGQLMVHGCVIDRLGYWNRYGEKYEKDRWDLCKTAFHIAVERAAKIARYHGAILKVHVERCSKKDDQRIRNYFNDMKHSGMPFDQSNSAMYQPLLPDELRLLLDEIDFKPKENRITQIADLALYPICRAAFQPDYPPYLALKNAGKLADTRYPPHWGIKYSCFDRKAEETPQGLFSQPSLAKTS